MAQLTCQREYHHSLHATATALPQYTDRGSHATRDLSCFFHPAKPVIREGQELTERLGQRPQSGYPETSFVLVLKAAEGDVFPIGAGAGWWEQVWNDKGSGLPDDYSVWRVKPQCIPSGYVCVSPCFFKKQAGGKGTCDPPSDADVEGMVALREALVKYVQANELTNVWDDRGTHAAADVSIYTGPDSLGLFAFPNYSPPPAGSSFPVANLSELGKKLA